MAEKKTKAARYVAIGLIVVTIVISIVGSFFIIQHWEYISKLEEQGYLGLFVISFFGGSPIPVPTPSMILTFTLGSVLNPLLVGLVSGLGNGIGNAAIFWTGRGGHHLFKNFYNPSTENTDSNSRIGRFIAKFKMPRVAEFARRRSGLAVFVLSIYPNPILTPLIFGMGAMRYRFWLFFFSVWMGKTAQGLILSYLGYYGLRSILKVFGIFDA